MSIADTDSKESHIVITDIDLNPIRLDNNPAHFDGFLAEVAEFCERTGHFLPLVEHGVAIRGHRTIIDSATAVPFFLGGVAGAQTYSADNPCPPTEQRLADHNAAMTAAKSPTIAGLTKVPTSMDSSFVVNKYVISGEDLSFGNSIAACFVNADYANRIRTEHGMGGRAMISRIRYLGFEADDAQKALVLRRFTKFAEAPVGVNLDATSFEM